MTKAIGLLNNLSGGKIKYRIVLIEIELANSITLNSEEIKLVDAKSKSQSELLSEKLSKTILHKILELKKKYKVTINKDVLDNIKVSSENDKNAIDMYIVKEGKSDSKTSISFNR